MGNIDLRHFARKQVAQRLLGLTFFVLLASCQSQEPEKVFVPAVQSQQATVDSEQVVEDGQQPTHSEPTNDQQSAANADVLFVDARQTGKETWSFSVKVQHPDTGWEDYADGWDVVLTDGSVAKPDADSPFTRLLLHPHVGEQPFTRSQSNITIPANVTTVSVRAHDLVDGFGGREVVVDLTAVSGSDFSVISEQ